MHTDILAQVGKTLLTVHTQFRGVKRCVESFHSKILERPEMTIMCVLFDLCCLFFKLVFAIIKLCSFYYIDSVFISFIYR